MKFSRRSLLAFPAIAALALIANVGSAQLLLPEFCQVNTCSAPSVGVPYTFIDNLVCWNGAVLTKKTGSTCPALSTEYHLDLGVYYPASGWVTPLDVNGPPQADGFCCPYGGGDCYVPASGLCPPDKIAFWCPDGQEPEYQNGEYGCK